MVAPGEPNTPVTSGAAAKATAQVIAKPSTRRVNDVFGTKWDVLRNFIFALLNHKNLHAWKSSELCSSNCNKYTITLRSNGTVGSGWADPGNSFPFAESSPSGRKQLLSTSRDCSHKFDYRANVLQVSSTTKNCILSRRIRDGIFSPQPERYSADQRCKNTWRPCLKHLGQKSKL